MSCCRTSSIITQTLIDISYTEHFIKHILSELPDPKKKKKGILKYPPKYAFEAQQIQFSVKTTEVSGEEFKAIYHLKDVPIIYSFHDQFHDHMWNSDSPSPTNFWMTCSSHFDLFISK